MQFAHFFIRRPIFAAVISIFFVLVGTLALLGLPIQQYPEIAPPTIVVTASYPGADAQTVSQTVAAPIEEQINGVENMLYMSSTSTDSGQMNLTVTFALGTDLDIAQVQVQNRVSQAEPRLPDTVRQVGITTTKRSPDLTLVVNMISPKATYGPLYLSNFALLQIRDELSRVDGVGEARIFGARDYSMRIWLDPDKLSTRNLTAGDVVSALREQNVQVAAGVVGQPPIPSDVSFQYTVTTQGRLISPQEFEAIVVATASDGKTVDLRDVARVELGAADYGLSTYLDGMPSVGIAIFQRPGSNSLDTADLVKARMEELKQSFPPDVEYRIHYDTTIFVRESINSVVNTLIEAIILVVLVVIVFLQSWRASLIPLIAVPVSIVGTFAVMNVLGFSLNTLSLFGLVLAIGIVVDDAIVVVENIERHIEEGLKPLDAAFKAMTEVSGPVIAIALVLSAVFIPTAFVSGISGQFYRQFALTIAVSTIISAINSLTLSPALGALLLRDKHGKQDWLTRLINFLFGWFFRLFNKTFNAAASGYAGYVRKVVRIPAIMLLFYAGLLVLTYFGFTRTPTGFIPNADQGYLIANVQLPDAASTVRTDAVVKRTVDTLLSTDGVGHVFALSGFSFLTSSNTSNVGTIFIILKPYEERVGHDNLSANAIAGTLAGKFAAETDALVLAFPPPPVRGVGTAGGFKMQIQDRGAGGSLPQLQAVTNDLISTVRQQEGDQPKIAGMYSSFRAAVPKLRAVVDRVKAKTMGVPLGDVFATLQIYLGSLYVNDFNFLGRTYRVVAQAETSFRLTPEQITQFKVRNSRGQMVPLGAFTTVERQTAADRVVRYNLSPSAEINGAAAPGVSTGEALAVMEKAAESLPQGYGYEWTELAYQERAAGNTAVYIFPLCVLFVFLMLAALYESWALPLAVILIVPMCLLAAIGGVLLRGQDNNIFTQIGFVVLVGLACKNAILIVEFAKQQEDEGKSRVDAVVEAARLRLRPILMTSFAFILGVVPLVIAEGAGAESRQALGTAVFAGMVGVTLFGLMLTPSFYELIRRFSRKTKTDTEPTPPD